MDSVKLREESDSAPSWEKDFEGGLGCTKKVHGFHAKERIDFLLKRFYNYRPGPNDAVDNIAAALESLRLEIADIKAEYAPPGPVMAITLMSAIEDPAYETTKHLLEREPELTLEAAKEALKSMEEHLKQDDAIEDAMENAHRANFKGKGPPRKCDFCKKTGHTKKYCWDWLDNTEKGQEWERNHPEQPRKSRPAKSESSKPTESATKASSKSRGRGRGAARVVEEDSESGEDAGWMTIEETVLENVSAVEFDVHEAEKGTGDWMLDSGASCHMTYQRSIFTKFTSYCAPIRIANGQQIWSEGRGSVSIEIDGKVIEMTNVLFVPQLDANLLSISALNRKGHTVSFSQRGVEILRRGTLVATGIPRGHTYLLRKIIFYAKPVIQTLN